MGTLVKRVTTSSDINWNSSLKCLSSSFLKNLKLFSIWLSVLGIVFMIILSRNTANEYKGLFIEETIIRKGQYCFVSLEERRLSEVFHHYLTSICGISYILFSFQLTSKVHYYPPRRIPFNYLISVHILKHHLSWKCTPIYPMLPSHSLYPHE